MYTHKTYRALTLFRGSLIALVFDNTLSLRATDNAKRDAITLMSADTDRICLTMVLMHDVYSSILEVAISWWLLYRYHGVAIAASTTLTLGMSICVKVLERTLARLSK